MDILRACLNWRVVGILVAVGAGLAVFAPNLIAGAIPLLIVAACPLSMLVMMRTMGGQQSSPSPRLDPGAVDRPAQLRDQLAAARLEQYRLERELTRLETSERLPTAEAQRNAPAPRV